MKINKIFIVFISLFLVFAVRCVNENKSEENKIVVEKRVEKRVGEADKYERYNEIKGNKELKRVKNILDNIKWENAEVSMTSPPHYKFHFEGINGNANGTVYELWISPSKDKVELVLDSASKYAELNKQVSRELFRIITGKELDFD